MRTKDDRSSPTSVVNDIRDRATVRPDQAQGRGRRCDAPRLYAHDSSGCRLTLSAFGRSIFASRHFPSQTFCNCRRLSGAAPSPLRSIMARSDVGLLGTDLIPSGPFLCGQPLAKRAPRAEARWATRFVQAALLGPVALGDEKGEGARQRSVPIPDSLSNELAMLSNAREGEGVSLERALSGQKTRLGEKDNCSSVGSRERRGRSWVGSP
jgi:hypothetical protein